MKMTCLIEDQKVKSPLKEEHGLSLWIEMDDQILLFDTGQSSSFIDNAKQLGLDLKKVDTVIISHGHYDHGGGLKAFLQMNHRANVYIQATAFKEYYSLRSPENYVYVGLDKSLKDHPQVKLLDGDFDINEKLHLIQDIEISDMYPKANKLLFVKNHQAYVNDDFRHEQSLIIRHKGTHSLIAGCAHTGILNIISAAEKHVSKPLDMVIGGFHLHSRHNDLNYPLEKIQDLGHQLLKKANHYVTGHCTGPAYGILKDILGQQLDTLYTGKTIYI